MKKVLISLLAVLCIFGIAGCEKVSSGEYKKGTYYGSAEDDFNGEKNTAIAVITVDDNGKIISVYVDSTYTANGVTSTKKSLGSSYGMKTGDSAYGVSNKEWYEQASYLEQAVVDHQGVDFLTIDDNGKTDTISGCTIKVDALKTAVANALAKAK